jgi:sulfoxide reductase heme-binding subunit YedZ
MLGLFAFFYATLHLLTYWSFDLAFALRDFGADVLRRPFIALGLAAFLLMVPLAVTSTKGWIRRLGRRWARLHQLVYLAAILAMIHFALKVKVFTGDPVAYAAALTAVLGFRVVWALRTRWKSAAA